MTASPAQSTAYSRIWESFLATPSTEDGRHDTPHWRSHDGPYAAAVIRVAAHSLQPDLDALRQSISQAPGVRLHPDHFLHIMLQEIGFVAETPSKPDEISVARLEEFAQSAIEPIASTSPFSLDFGGANAFLDAVFLEVLAGELLSQLHARLFELAALPGKPEFPFLPHCTIAHFDGTAPSSAAASAILPWRQSQFGRIEVTEVEIVTLDSAQAYPELESYAVIPLGG